jgi:hypothetical protein
VSSAKTVYEIRRTNLRKLIADTSAANVSKQLGYTNASFLSQMAGPNPSRQVSEKQARQIEEKLGLRPGWLDTDSHVATNMSQTLDEGLLTNCIRAVQMYIEDTGKAPKADVVAEVVSLVYEHSKALEGRFDEGFVRRLVNLAVR